jgi:hypothetical protein
MMKLHPEKLNIVDILAMLYLGFIYWICIYVGITAAFTGQRAILSMIGLLFGATSLATGNMIRYYLYAGIITLDK